MGLAATAAIRNESETAMTRTRLTQCPPPAPADEVPPSSRPTVEELSAARAAIKALRTAAILPDKATRVDARTVACAIALHGGEHFGTDTIAKRRFDVPVTTNVRKLWLPRLEGLARWRAQSAEARQNHPCANLATEIPQLISKHIEAQVFRPSQ